MVWHEKNGKSIEFMRKMKANGRATALDHMPVLSEDGISVWNIYCIMSDDILHSLYIYDLKIGLPIGWNFEECLIVLRNMNSKVMKMREKDD